jgi:LPS-assembly protein
LDKTEDALNQLPYIRLDSIRYELGKNFFLQWNSNYNNYWRKNLDRGQVLELNPIIYYPYKFLTYLNTETSVGVGQTFFQAQNQTSNAVQDWGARTVPNFKLDWSTDIQRVFDVSGESVRKMKHSMRPQIVYNYIPEITDNNTAATLPTFISPLNKTNVITYYLNNVLTAKNYIGPGKDGEDLHSYLDFIYFKVYQSYDFNEANRDENTPSTTVTPGTTGISGTTGVPGPRRPFSSVVGELEFIPSPYLRLRSFAGWSPYTNQFDNQTHTLTLSTRGGSWVALEYQNLNADQFRQLNTSLLWKINPTWTANFLNKWSIDQNLNYETTVGLAYAHQCWGIKASYTATLDNTVFLVSFSLKGLGDF